MSVLCALSLFLVAFAHRPVFSEPRVSDPTIAAYLAMGGSLSDLCISDADGKQGGSHADCQACRLVKSTALTAASLELADIVAWSVERPIRPSSAVVSSHGPRVPPVRGPPSFLMI